MSSHAVEAVQALHQFEYMYENDCGEDVMQVYTAGCFASSVVLFSVSAFYRVNKKLQVIT